MRAEAWLAALDHELQALDLATERRVEIVAEAESALHEADEDPVDHLGLPDEYAALVAAALRRPVPTRPPGAVVVRVDRLVHHFGARHVLGPLDLDVRAGRVVALMGRNGAGKSTLLEILAGLRTPSAGSMTVSGTVGYAPQHGGLNPWLTPLEHAVLFGAGHGLTREDAEADARALARELGLDIATPLTVGKLSGGNRQKVRVMTAAIGHPSVLLLDEPYQGLDVESTRRFWQLVWQWGHDGGAVVIASHSADALRCADEVVELDGVMA